MKWLAGLLLAVLILVSAGSVLTLGEISIYACIDCGIAMERTDFLGRETSRLERTSRTEWYDRRIGTPHDHRWTKAACSTGLNLWKARTEFRYGPSEPLASDHGEMARVLLGLERMNLDVAFHHHLTHADRRHRIAAAQAAHELDPAAHVTSLDYWWQKASTYLADPSLWQDSYRKWASPSFVMHHN